MFQPTLGRFLSRDPLSADGADVVSGAGIYAERSQAMSAEPWYYGGNSEHPYVYARNNPLRYVDPSGMMSVKPLGSNLKPVCGGDAWIEWDFVLDKDAPCDGYFVQQVKYRCTVKDCTGCPNTSPGDPDKTFWEAWFVKAGDRLELNRKNGRFTYTDRNSTRGIKKCGLKSSIGTIKFFCVTMTGDLGMSGKPNPKSGWEIGVAYLTGDCTVRPGNIPHTDKKPSWWDDPPIESATRYASLYWNCCCHDNRDFVLAEAEPK